MFKRNYTKKGELKALNALKIGRKFNFVVISGKQLREDEGFYIDVYDYIGSVLDDIVYIIINNHNIIRKGKKRWDGNVLKYADERVKDYDGFLRELYNADTCSHNDRDFVKICLTAIADTYTNLKNEREACIDYDMSLEKRLILIFFASALWSTLPRKMRKDQVIYEVAEKIFLDPNVKFIMV